MLWQKKIMMIMILVIYLLDAKHLYFNTFSVQEKGAGI